MVYMQGR